VTVGPELTHLLYLHGFRSSPQSTKARQVAAWMHAQRPDVVWWCPPLPPSPLEAMKRVAERVSTWPAGTSAVIGSSLGGFYATWVAERFGWRAVLLNPAVFPARDLARYIGEQQGWHDPQERFYFRAEFVDELRALDAGPISRPERYFAIVAKGDELLDWREMVARYPGARIKLLEDSDHALSDFGDHFADVLGFLRFWASSR
jgi:hypothetical protein